MKNLLFLSLLLLFACGSNTSLKEVQITNHLNIPRSGETISLQIDEALEQNSTVDFEKLAVVSGEGKILPHQLIDSDSDGSEDILIFQAALAANSTSTYKLIESDRKADSLVNTTYARLIPERIDDYAWENDRIAFRTYGPAAQEIAEKGLPGGIVSSGIDCWLKRVEYPIIDKWYAKNSAGGSYHEDDGEGLDNFHVGISRGCGGTGVWDEENNTLHLSKNFTTNKTLAEGPIRTLFELDYAPYAVNEKEVKVTKLISLDLGTNLTRYEISVEGTNVLSVGLAYHEKDGNTSMDEAAAWFSYWQPHADSELGTAILVSPDRVAGVTEYMVEEQDKSNYLVHLKVIDGKVVFYSGFSWKKSGQYTDEEAWNNYLAEMAQKLASPLEVIVN